MAIPEGYTKLAVVGYSDKGVYSSGTTYNKYNVVLYEGSSYVALKDNLVGVTPSDDGVNWRIFAQGLEVVSADNIDVNDTPDVTGGGSGNKVKLQALIDKLSDWWLSKLTERLVNNGTTTTSGQYALDAAFGKNLQDQVSKLNANIPHPPEIHRNLFRGKNLGNTVTEAQKTAIQNGTFEDLYVGDYWVIDGVNWRIVDIDYWMLCGDTSLERHHLIIMPDTSLYNAQMDDTNTTTGGYVGSNMYTENLEQAKTSISNAFNDMVITHREYLTNAVTNGYPSAGNWCNSTIELPNEIMMYGSYVHTPAGNGDIIPNRYTISKSQLALFNLVPKFIHNRQHFWLRDIVSVVSFAYVDNYGTANYGNAKDLHGVRPVFAIG